MWDFDWVETGRSSISGSRRREETPSDSSGTAGQVQHRAGARETCESHTAGGCCCCAHRAWPVVEARRCGGRSEAASSAWPSCWLAVDCWGKSRVHSSINVYWAPSVCQAPCQGCKDKRHKLCFQDPEVEIDRLGWQVVVRVTMCPGLPGTDPAILV